jgi:hypothetical protein
VALAKFVGHTNLTDDTDFLFAWRRNREVTKKAQKSQKSQKFFSSGGEMGGCKESTERVLAAAK